MVVWWRKLSPRAGWVLLPLLLIGGLIASPGARAQSSANEAPSSPSAYARGHVLVRYRGTAGERKRRLAAGVSVSDALARLRASPRVAYANPDYLVRAAAGCWPNDPGRTGCWRDDQWNFLPFTPGGPGGVDAPGAWQNLKQATAPGGRGATVAVLDTGIAYRKMGKRFRRDPDLPPMQRFVAPKNYVGHGRFPLDEDGHGTHVASTIAQSTRNHRGLTGLAFGVKVMPVRVLNRREKGTGSDVARGVRYAASHGADVINLSLEFGPKVKRCDQVPAVCRAVRMASARGIVVAAAAGNQHRARVAFPGAAPDAIAVGATTWRGCLARYSDFGMGLDLVAPGGGGDFPNAGAQCHPSAQGYSIRQFSLKPRAAARGDFRSFGIVGMHGTSMAAAHVSAAAALLLAEGMAPEAVANRLKCTATPLGAPLHYGAGLLNAAQATSAATCP
jgi:serine protease